MSTYELKAGASVTVFVCGYIQMRGKCESVFKGRESGIVRASVRMSESGNGYKAGELAEFMARDTVPSAAIRESKQRIGGVYNLPYSYVLN